MVAVGLIAGTRVKDVFKSNVTSVSKVRRLSTTSNTWKLIVRLCLDKYACDLFEAIVGIICIAGLATGWYGLATRAQLVMAVYILLGGTIPTHPWPFFNFGRYAHLLAVNNRNLCEAELNGLIGKHIWLGRLHT